MRWNAIALATTFALSVAVGCSKEAAPPARAFVEVSAGDVVAGSAVPAPAGDPVLVMKGRTGARNLGETLAFDMQTLRKLRQVSATVYEPFLKREVEFTGVLMSDLLDVAGLPSTASRVHMVALDDFTADFTVGALRSQPVLLALLQDGQPMPVDKGGPSRIVFPTDVGLAKNTDNWIWSLKEMDVL